MIHSLPPEPTHAAALFALRHRHLWRAVTPLLRVDAPRMHTTLAGIPFRNPIGLAAGYDKNAECPPALAALGFGYVTCGTVTASPRPGNPKPRMLRRRRDKALVNSLGFPNKGLEHAARLIERALPRMEDTPIMASISGDTPDDIALCHARLQPLVAAIELNISSPNTRGLQAFQRPDALSQLLDRLNHDRGKPLFVKLPRYVHPPSTDDARREDILALTRVCQEHDVDALTVANTLPVSDSSLAAGTGGLSGKPLLPSTLRIIADIRADVGHGIAINASGGIFIQRSGCLSRAKRGRGYRADLHGARLSRSNRSSRYQQRTAHPPALMPYQRRPHCRRFSSSLQNSAIMPR